MAKTHATTGPSYLWILLGLVLIVGILFFAKAFIIPLALAGLLTFVLTPIVSFLERLGLTRVPAVLVTVLLALGAFTAVGWGVGLQVNALVHQLPEHKEKIKTKIADLRGSGEGALGNFLQMIREVTEEPEKIKDGLKQADPQEKQVVVVRPDESSNLERLVLAAAPILEPLATAGLVIILVIFCLSGREDLRNRFIGLLGHGHLTGTTRIIVDAAQRLSSFLLTQLSVNVGFGAIFGFGLLLIGVPYAFLWGFFTALMRFVPYIGTWISVIFPLTLSFALAPNWTQPIIVLVFFSVMDLVVANAVEPLLFGHSTGVTPIALLVAAAFWTWVWGPIGLVLSTPLTVCLVVLGQHVPRLQFFALLLGSQPPLEPRVSYYQRLLSRDMKEAEQIASDYVKTHGLDKVFDDVLLPALVLARRDRRQEGLSAEDEEFLLEETGILLTKLESEAAAAATADATAAAAAAEEPKKDGASMNAPGKSNDQAHGRVVVLACPSHQKAEEVSLRMFALLMKSSGFDVEVLSTRTLPAEVEERVARDKPLAVFIAVLPPGGLVQVRYLCRRLRRRFADLPVIVGYWSVPQDFDRLLVNLRSAGATYVATSLLQACSRTRALIEPLNRLKLPPTPLQAAATIT